MRLRHITGRRPDRGPKTAAEWYGYLQERLGHEGFIGSQVMLNHASFMFKCDRQTEGYTVQVVGIVRDDMVTKAHVSVYFIGTMPSTPLLRRYEEVRTIRPHVIVEYALKAVEIIKAGRGREVFGWKPNDENLFEPW